MPLTVAIVGSGPAGFYTAAALKKGCGSCKIDIIERLPTPFGLIRSGVAPDHQSIKKISKNFNKIALLSGINYYGNVHVGNSISVPELCELYSAVVLAVGTPDDQKLSIPGAEKTGVFGSAAFTGWYNGHPDYQDLNPNLQSKTVAIIGAGNVALDIARILVRSAEEMATSDLPDYAGQTIHNSPIQDVYILGRRGPSEAKFSNLELSEMETLNNATSLTKAEQIPIDSNLELSGLSCRDKRMIKRNLKTLRAFANNQAIDKLKRVRLEFFSMPTKILGRDCVEALRCERTKIVNGTAVCTGDFFEIECELIISAIGYRSAPIDNVPMDNIRGLIANENGYVYDGLYAVGWAKRGSVGVISSNRYDGEIVAKQIIEKFDSLKTYNFAGRKGLERLLKARGIRYVTYKDWKRLDFLEVKNAIGLAPRRKFVTVKEMLDALDS